MLDFGFYNEDCLPCMKEYPDNYFDLAVVDPPYGSGISEGNRTDELGVHFHGRGRSKKYQEIYTGIDEKPKNLGGGRVQPFRSEIRPIQEPATTPLDYARRERVTRTGGTWAGKYAKKSLRGMSRRGMNTLKNCSASHGIR